MDNKIDLNSEDKIRMDKACELYKEGSLNEALPILEKLYKSHLTSPMLVATLANLYWDLNNIEKALELFQNAVNLGPDSEKISRGLFHILWEQDDETNAVKEIQRFINTGHASDEYIEMALEIKSKRGFDIRI